MAKFVNIYVLPPTGLADVSILFEEDGEDGGVYAYPANPQPDRHSTLTDLLCGLRRRFGGKKGKDCEPASPLHAAEDGNHHG